ncbi:hypothetical protein CASFOL_024637 [Castilleja foliolosa]|uniref:Microtubule-binding protein TANGLED n=1 Tax=Castilleja foliolosa TaxID=1961234 RepID=A0ABD3CPS6_9LAMI
MVARTPPKQQRKMVVAAPHLSPTLLRETVKKVDKCMARLQELQYTVTGGAKVTSDVNFRSKHESLRIRNGNSRRSSPAGKLPAAAAEHWRRMSLPAMLLGETMGEVLQASQFARNIVKVVSASTDGPKTPPTQRRNQNTNVDNSGLMMQSRRRREKQVLLQSVRSDDPRPLQRAKSRINFKLSSPECEKQNCRYMANRVSPRNRPWVKKTVLFPNPLYHSTSPTSQHQKLVNKTKSPVIARNRQVPHKFLIKSPPQVKIKSPTRICISPTRTEKASSSMRRSFSPSRLANRLISPLKCRKLVQKKNEEANKCSEIARSRQLASYKFLIKSPPDSKMKKKGTSPNRATILGKKSFSPPRLVVANRIAASPLKIRNFVRKNEETMKIISGNKRPTYWSSQFSPPQRI